MKKYQLVLFFAVGWSVLCTILFCLPGSILPERNWFQKIWLDKWVHLGLFSLLVFLWSWYLTVNKRKTFPAFFLVAISCLVYGIAIEFIQKYLIPNRSFDLTDILADGLGCALGLYLAMKLVQKNRPL